MGKAIKGEKRPVSWKEGEYTVTRSSHWSAPGCHAACGILFYYDEDGKLVKVEGDEEASYNQGTLCMRCLNLPEIVNDPKRLKYPMRRKVEDRGKDAWERITWDEAIDEICDKVRYYQENFGNEYICVMHGTGRETWWTAPFMAYTAFQTPNFGDALMTGDSCYMPRMVSGALMNGDMCVADCAQFFPDRYDDPRWIPPKIMVVWGNNPIISNADGFLGHWVVECMKRGTEIIMVDPAMIWLSAKAKIWLPIRPGTDAAMALAWLNVIIEEDLVDHDFIDCWTYGFEDLAERVKEYTPEKVAEICWVPAEKIREAARVYATAHPAAIQWGVSIDMQESAVPAGQALNCLWAITGNMDVPGGNIIARTPFDVPLFGEAGLPNVPPELIAKRIGDQEYPFRGAGLASQSALGDAYYKALETGIPYRPKMLWINSANPLATMAPQPARAKHALNQAEFVVCVDYVMTPTIMAAADMVLPCAMSCERDTVRAWWAPLRTINKAGSYYEARPDEDIFLTLINRLNPDMSPGKTTREWMDTVIRGGSLDIGFEELREYTEIYDEFEYRKYEKGLLRFDGGLGFLTPTGRLELKLDIMDRFGLDSLPYHQEPTESPYSTPELCEEYPFILSGGQRSYEYFHSEGRNQPTLRSFHPDPICELNSTVAQDLGIDEGDWVLIENHRGKAKMRARLSAGLNPKIVRAEHGWWFPEREGAAPEFFGCSDSNINALTSVGVMGPAGFGAPYKCGVCNIRKCTPDEEAQSFTAQLMDEEV